jgi:hypothetical protein
MNTTVSAMTDLAMTTSSATRGTRRRQILRRARMPVTGKPTKFKTRAASAPACPEYSADAD